MNFRRPVLAGILLVLGLASAGGQETHSAIPRGSSLFRIDPARSSLRFDAYAAGHVVHGLTHRVAGEVIFDPENLSRRADVTIRVEAATLETGNQVRDRKMRKSHLETERFPAIVFRSTRIEAIAPTLRPGETQELRVKGTLALHGVDRSLAFPVTATRRGDEIRVTGEVPLRLTDFAIPIPRFLFVKLKDEVKVRFEVVANAPPVR